MKVLSFLRRLVWWVLVRQRKLVLQLTIINKGLMEATWLVDGAVCARIYVEESKIQNWIDNNIPGSRMAFQCIVTELPWPPKDPQSLTILERRP